MAGDTTLICYDGSAAARHASRTAAALLGGGPATVLTVWEPFEPSLLRPVGDAVAVAAGIAREFDEVALEIATEHAREGARLAGKAGFQTVPLVRPGHPRDVILEVAHQTNARAIVLGSRGAGAVESVLLGSVSAALLHHCRDIPLLLVPHAAE